MIRCLISHKMLFTIMTLQCSINLNATCKNVYFPCKFQAIHINCKVDKLKLCKSNCICWSKHRRRHLTNAYHKHVIGVCLFRQSASEKQNHDAEAQKPLRIQWMSPLVNCVMQFFFSAIEETTLLHAIASILRFVLCSLDQDLLRAQRIIVFYTS